MTRHSGARNAAIVAAFAAFALVLGGCAGATPATSPTPSGSPSAALLPFDGDTLTATVEDAATEMRVPGVVAYVRTTDGEFVAEHGVTEFGGTTPVSVDDRIRIGSNTKTWTGTVILQLAQEGVLSLDDPVSDYRPEVPNGENITIAQLLTMRSGLANFTATLEHNEAMDADPQRVWQPEELLAIAFALPPAFAPGEGFLYSNTNTVLLGLIAEQLDGKPLEEIFQERLFEPLDLTSTLFPPLTSHAIPEPYSRGYQFGTNVESMDGALSPELQQQAADGELAPIDHTDDNPSWGWAAGAGISTLTDLVTWVEALTEGGLLDDEYQALRMESLTRQSDDPQSALYGLAIAQFGPLYGHTGELPGYNSFMGHDPETGVTVVVWANLAPLPDGRAPAIEIAKTLIGQIYPPAG